MTAGNFIVGNIKNNRKSNRVFNVATKYGIHEQILEMKANISETIFKDDELVNEWNEGTQLSNYEGIERYAESDRDDDLHFSKDGLHLEINKEEAIQVVNFLEGVTPSLKEKAIERMQTDIPSLQNLIQKIIK